MVLAELNSWFFLGQPSSFCLQFMPVRFSTNIVVGKFGTLFLSVKSLGVFSMSPFWVLLPPKMHETGAGWSWQVSWIWQGFQSTPGIRGPLDGWAVEGEWVQKWIVGTGRLSVIFISIDIIHTTELDLNHLVVNWWFEARWFGTRSDSLMKGTITWGYPGRIPTSLRTKGPIVTLSFTWKWPKFGNHHDAFFVKE